MLLGVILLVCGAGQGLSHGAPLHSQFPLGTIGCLFMENLCQVEEECVDDLLFGNCQRVDRVQEEPYQYQLSQKSLGSLQDQIRSLIRGGYSWNDPLTQCLIQNALYAYRKHRTFYPSKCETVEASWTDQHRDYDVNNEISTALEKLFQEYYNAYEPQGSNVLLGKNADKRDEIIKVHKYFDKSPQPYLKRDFSSDDREHYSNYLSGAKEWQPYEADNRDSYDLSPNDLQQLHDYLQELRAADDQGYGQVFTGDFDQARPVDNDVAGFYQDSVPVDSDVYSADQYDNSIDSEPYSPDQYDNSVPQDILDSQAPWEQTETKGDNPYEWSKVEETQEDGNDEPKLLTSSDPEIGLPAKYAELLSKLMIGQIRPENLTDDELNYLTEYVNIRLGQMGYTPEQLKEIAGEQNRAGTMEAEMPLNSLETNEEENSDSDNEEEKIISAMESEMGVAPSEDKRVLGIPVVGSVIKEDKKSVDPAKPDTEPASQVDDPNVNDIVNTDYAFVEFTKHLDRDTASSFLSALEHMLDTSVPFDPAEDYENRVTFFVNEKLTHVNASTVARVVEERKSDLESLTGVKIVRAGIGYRNQVEVKPPDDRYFVLTFVLCGCIAGILLAVVVIYLIRRYSKSKEKLAQLSANGDNTEASKDYQDLCRQRMQGKSSEKPEPLHAASRIGSVSESQVRSPSSRSSTSSWSEEPVSSNMDISTGHIVLSYMEDHLKNNDRLDREWEGLGAYEADPNSTKVASDPSNLRKNRYSDVLPYDHSRVILSNTSNVSGSDYINASSITDHDPRNPAYIATQGPLPHTIADFWQMVWEQGSVVIVMLSKMSENGEAMCHRYWPEEGSDLYHIYEVHLVSEHIWCDDYLVRSFYLKNLQTNETRTVTMFHYLTWPDLGVPSSIKALLDFRRKVNKSYRGRSCPIVVHCSDGCGRTGTYCLVDMVLNRMAKGAKEIDIAATLEHIRDQRMCTVKTKEQFQFALAAVAEEVHAILKALPQ